MSSQLEAADCKFDGVYYSCCSACCSRETQLQIQDLLLSNNAHTAATRCPSWQRGNWSFPGLLHYRHQTEERPTAKYHPSAHISWKNKSL